MKAIGVQHSACLTRLNFLFVELWPAAAR